jgi:hypothetical protein
MTGGSDLSYLWFLFWASVRWRFKFRHFCKAAKKKKKKTVSFIMSVRPSTLPHGTTLSPVDGRLRNLVFHYFPKICQENPSSVCTLMTTSRWILPIMKKFSDKTCKETQKQTYCVQKRGFPKIPPFMGRRGKIRYSRRGQSWHNTAHALCLLDN